MIAPGKLTDFCPLYCAQGTDAVISQYDKDDVEAIGLVKFDFLGLTTLTILDLTLHYVRALDPAFAFTLATLPLDDPTVYDIFKRAQTVAIFQFESRGMRELLKRAKPDRLEDLIALNALYRPGPMDLIADFVDRKQGRQRIDYLHPALAPILAETYGIMVYQEQVMRIAQVIGGYSLGSADLLRRAMGKKKADEMAQQRDIFVAGAERNGVARETATQLFDLMEKFAGYGFNKSHSAAYALLAYQTAYFKAHYPAAFMAANLSAVMDDTDKVKELIEDSRQLGLTVLAPALNSSAYRFVPVDAKTIRYGLGAIKGTGAGAISAIVAGRGAAGDRSDAVGQRPFSDLFEFCSRVDARAVNRRAVEALVRAGAFDALGVDRAMLFASVGRAIEQAERAAAHAGQANLFGRPGETSAAAADYVPCQPWSERERLANEKLALGYYFSGHLFTEFEREARRLAPTRLADVRPNFGERAGDRATERSGDRAGERFGSKSDPVRLAGIIVSARTQNTRRGRIGVVVLDDGSAQLELMVFSELFDRKRALLKEDTLVFVTGRVRFDDFNQRLSISADDVIDLAEARARGAARLRIDVDGAVDAARLHEILAPYRLPAEAPATAAAAGMARAGHDANRRNGAGNGHGQASVGCRVVVHYRNSVGVAELALPDSWRIRPEDAVLADLKSQPRVLAATFAY